MIFTTKLFTTGSGLLLASLLITSLFLPQPVMADVTCCINQNDGNPCVDVCYVTDLTCADITIGFIINSCTDNAVGGGGGGGAGVLDGIHELFDGQVNIGSGPFPVTVDIGITVLDNFVFTRPVSDHANLDQFIQVLGFDGLGNIYRSDVPTAGLDLFDQGDLVIQATPGGMEIPNPMAGSFSVRVASGDVTLSVDVLDRSDNITVLNTLDTPVVFSDLTWTYVGEGAVGTQGLSWDALKANYFGE